MKIILPDYNNSIMNVSNSILKFYNVTHQYSTIPMVDEYLTPNINHIIYILLDGMGVNLIKTHLNKDDVLYRYMKKEISSVFPPTTVAATNAVISATPPLVNGHIGWVQYFTDENVNLVVFQNKDFYSGVEYKENLREKHLSYKRLTQMISEQNIDVVTNEIFPEIVSPNGTKSFNDAVERVLAITHNTDKSFNYLYWIEPDITQHIYGIDSPESKKVLKDLNSDFGELLDNVPENTIVICIADHGLTDVEEIALYNFPQITDLLTRKPSLEPRACNFFVKEGRHKEFQTEFNKVFRTKFQLYTRQEIIDKGVFGEGVIHPKFMSFLGDFIAVAIDKYMFGLTESKGYKGHHAGLSEDEMIVPLILYKKTTI